MQHDSPTRGTARRDILRGLAAWTAAALLFGAAGAAANAQSLSERRLRNGASVREAFRSVVAEPSRWTVRVLADKKPIAFGLIVDKEGYVLTKASELNGGLACELKGGKTAAAEIVGIHPETDLALLKIAAKAIEDLPAAAWRQAGDPPVGGWVVTPGLDELPVSVGVVSVARREIKRQSGVLGVTIADEEDGAKITRIFSNSGAERAGLKVGDIVTAIDGTAVKSSEALTGLVRTQLPGQTLRVTVRRGEKAEQFRVTLGDAMDAFFERGSLQNRMGGDLSTRRYGFPVALQHDTYLKPTECGGPVVDLEGRVVGLNIARAGRTESYAIPASEILPLLADLKAGKYAPKDLEPPPTAVIGPPAPEPGNK
ncbi:MAG: PDZ domain-containing protein [Planctomycetales bacterium]